MAALIGKTEVGVREFGSSVAVPEDPTARLMYYLTCMCVLLDMNDHPNIERLTYYDLSEDEIDTLVLLCVLLSPDELNDKVMFQDDGLCKGSANNFYELSAVRNTILLTETVLIGGQTKSVSKIMAYKQDWLMDYWIIPMAFFKQRIERIARGGKPEAQRSIAYHQTFQSTARESFDQISQISEDSTVANNTYRDDDSCCCTIL